MKDCKSISKEKLLSALDESESGENGTILIMLE